MKKLILILAVLMIGLGATAQRTITDTIQGAETVSFTAMQGAKSVTATCTDTFGGTSDGTLALYGSTDNTNWTFTNFVGGVLGVASPQASITGTDLNQLTITGSLIGNWVPLDNVYDYYKIVGIGTSGDTTKVVITWSK